MAVSWSAYPDGASVPPEPHRAWNAGSVSDQSIVGGGASGSDGLAPQTPVGSPFGSERFFNRDLSWVAFNRRVLELASDDLPLLERVKLFAIVASNLDEFFAVRMAALQRMAARITSRFPDGRLPAEALADVRVAVLTLQAAQDNLWLNDLLPALASERVRVASVADLCKAHQLPRLRKRFQREIEPLLTPIAIGRAASFPRVRSGALNIGAIVAGGSCAPHRLVHISVPDSLPRFLEVCPGVWVALEDVILRFLPRVLGSGAIDSTAVFRITRDAELPIASDAEDLVDAVDTALRQRGVGAIVRLETNSDVDPDLVEMLKSKIGVRDDNVYESRAPLGLRDLFQLSDIDRADLKNRPWSPVTPPAFTDGRPQALLARIRQRPLLVHHPYHSFDTSVVAFASAARDPNVAALKATVYRTGDSSAVLASLIETAAEGKQAVAFVELRARFDERRNVMWVRELMDAGVDVVYGVPNLKVHAKLALLVRQERGGPRRYAHIGTGNYHASNAGSYEDLSLFTADQDIAADVAHVFNALTGQAQPTGFRKLLVGPWFLRNGLLAEIERVVRAVQAGQEGRIRIKVNSLLDPEIADGLYRASQAGVIVEVITRGICALRPGVPGCSERITVRSVLGRFLEHSRILTFETDERTTTWIGSADLMPRNLEDRVEVLAPVEDADLRAELTAILDALMKDTRSSWQLEANGAWHRRRPDDGAVPVSAQELLMARASALTTQKRKEKDQVQPNRKEHHVRQLVH
jgi:polyphosphate kinase